MQVSGLRIAKVKNVTVRERNACTVRNDDVIIRAYNVTCTTSHTYSSIRIRNTSIYKTQLTDRIVFFFSSY